MMSPESVLASLARLGVRVEAVSGNRLRYHPASAVPPELIEQLRQHKMAILAMLRGQPADQPAATEPPAAQRELTLARQLAKTWADVRSQLEQLVLGLAEHRGYPRVQLASGVWLLPGRDPWRRFAANPCTQPSGLIRALEELLGRPVEG
jgi:hypothetical protein